MFSKFYKPYWFAFKASDFKASACYIIPRLFLTEKKNKACYFCNKI